MTTILIGQIIWF